MNKSIIVLLLILIGIGKVTASDKVMNVGILVYEGVYLLDFAGPMEVFNDATLVDTNAKMNVYTFSIDGKEFSAHTGLKSIPTYSLGNCPKPDILIIPGGDLNISVNEPKLKEWLLQKAPECDLVLSVCTGAFILAKIGLLDGMNATTWHGAIAGLQKISDKIKTQKNVRYTDNGKLVTTAGISAGIDGSLYVIEKLFGKSTADKTAKYMDYEYWPNK